MLANGLLLDVYVTGAPKTIWTYNTYLFKRIFIISFCFFFVFTAIVHGAYSSANTTNMNHPNNYLSNQKTIYVCDGLVDVLIFDLLLAMNVDSTMMMLSLRPYDNCSVVYGVVVVTMHDVHLLVIYASAAVILVNGDRLMVNEVIYDHYRLANDVLVILVNGHHRNVNDYVGQQTMATTIRPGTLICSHCAAI